MFRLAETTELMGKSPGAACHRKARTHLIEQLTHGVAACEIEACIAGTWPRAVGRHLRPKFAQPIDSVIRRIACDDGGVDGADRYAGNPIRLNSGLAQRLVDAGLIGAKGAATL